MIEDILGCDKTNITNKSARITVVKHLNAMGVLVKIGMKLTPRVP